MAGVRIKERQKKREGEKEREGGYRCKYITFVREQIYGASLLSRTRVYRRISSYVEIAVKHFVRVL